VKVDRQGYIVAYRRLVVRGQHKGRPDGPYHVAVIASYTELDLDRLLHPGQFIKVDALEFTCHRETKMLVS
jgi:hypothetical protein